MRLIVCALIATGVLVAVGGCSPRSEPVEPKRTQGRGVRMSEAPRVLADAYRDQEATWLGLLDMYVALHEYRWSLEQLNSALPSMKDAKMLQQTRETLLQGRIVEDFIVAISEYSAECYEYGKFIRVEIADCEACKLYIVEQAGSPSEREKWETAQTFEYPYPEGMRDVMIAQTVARLDGFLGHTHEFLTGVQEDKELKKLDEYDQVLEYIQKAKKKLRVFLQTHREYKRICSLPVDAPAASGADEAGKCGK